MNEKIALLLALQEKDQLCRDLSLQVKDLEAQRSHVEQKRKEERAVVDALRQHLERLRHESQQKNIAVDELDLKIRDYQKQLEEGIISFKEMEALRTKISNQRRRISEMEDAALALMDEIEATACQLEEAREKLARREEKLSADCDEIDSQIVRIKEEIALREEERDGVASKIPVHILSRYEHLHAKFDDPIVPITDGSCSGCKLTVSGITIERVGSDLEIVTCENCSRILYLP